MERVTWLDGLRGAAAFVVSFNHYFKGEIKAPFRSFWDDPPEENRLMIQLFPIRLLFAAYAMVPLFMVIGGFATYVSFLRSKDLSGLQTPLHPLQSAITRKFFRLYLPVVVLALISQLAYFLDLYRWDFPESILRGIKPWTYPWSHLKYMVQHLLDNMDVIIFQWNRSFNGQIWTIPFDFRGSCILYLLILALSSWRTNLRLSALTLMLMHLLWYGHWDAFSYTGGLYLAELRIALDSQPAGTKSQCFGTHRHGISQARWASFGNKLLLTGGIYLLCLDGEEQLPLGYRRLSSFQSPHWTKYDAWVDIRFCWQAVGAMLAVFAISGSPSIQRLLESWPLQYLGRISPSLYLIHELVYRLLRNPVRDFVWSSFRNDGHPASDLAHKDPVPFWTAWVGSGLILGPVTICSAEIFHRYVDQKCVSLAKQLEIWTRAPQKAKEA